MVLRIPAPRTATATAIFFHGLGDSGAGLSFLASETHKVSELQHIDFVLPTAPTRHYAAFGGSTTGWFDMRAMGCSMDRAIDDLRGVETSLALVHQLVEQEIANGVPPHRILIGGFSQGSGLAQAAAFTSQHQLAGFAPLSGMLPHADHFTAHLCDANLNTPVFLAHGMADDVVPVEENNKSFELFKRAKFTNVEQHQYPALTHSLSMDELSDLFAFMKKCLPANK